MDKKIKRTKIIVDNVARKPLPVIAREYVEKNYIHKDKVRELRQKIHNDLDHNAITRGYQIFIDEYFEELLKE